MRPREQPPPKTLGTEFLMSSGGQHFTHIVITHCWRKEVCPVRLQWEKTLEAGDCPPLAFPLWDLAFCPFAVVSHSHEYDSQLTLSPVTPLSEPKNLEVVLGNCDMMAT